MTVLITLTTAGTDTGPFNLYSNVDGYVSAFETGVSKAALLAGYSSALVPNGTTTIRIKSTGTCVNYIDVTVVTTTTTTSSTTSTTSSTTSTSSTTTTSSTTEPPTQLLVYAKYITAPSAGSLQFSINGGPNFNAGAIPTSSCNYMFTISGITAGDSIAFSDTNTQAIAGSTSVCPSGPGGFGCTYNYSVLVSGSQTAYISVDGVNVC
jgi:hypothetical protein